MSERLRLDSTNWHRLIVPYARPDWRRSVWQLINTLSPYLALWVAMLWSLKVSYWLTLALAVPAAALRVRAYILFHDCCHGSLFRTRGANETIGVILGPLVYTSFYNWRHDHLVHHASAGNLDRRGVGDVPTWTVAEYLAAPGWKRAGYRVMRHPLFLFTIGSTLVFLVWHRTANPATDARGRRTLLYNNIILAMIYLGLGLLVGFKNLLMIELPVIILAANLGVWMFYVQHQFEGVFWGRTHEWSFLKAGLEGSSYFELPAIPRWITGNIGFHHVHHLGPRIPNYNLARCHRETPELQIKPLTIRGSLKSARLHLWDEENRELVGYDRLPKRIAE